MTALDRIILLLTGLTAIYLLLRFCTRYSEDKALHDIYYMMGFLVLLVSGLLLIFFGWGILASPYVLTVATLIPLGISMGLMNQFRPNYKKYYSWFALVGFLAIAVTSIGGMPLKSVAVPVFHGVAGLIIFGLPLYLCTTGGDVPKGFSLVGIGGALIGVGGIALAFLSAGSQLLFFSQGFVLTILAPLLFLMTLAFTWGFMQDLPKKVKISLDVSSPLFVKTDVTSPFSVSAIILGWITIEVFAFAISFITSRFTNDVELLTNIVLASEPIGAFFGGYVAGEIGKKKQALHGILIGAISVIIAFVLLISEDTNVKNLLTLEILSSWGAILALATIGAALAAKKKEI